MVAVRDPPGCCKTPADGISFRRPVASCFGQSYCFGQQYREIFYFYVPKGAGLKTVEIITRARDNARAQMT